MPGSLHAEHVRGGRQPFAGNAGKRGSAQFRLQRAWCLAVTGFERVQENFH
jgi:hypothetical protein